ncbi:MAG: macrolide 2'-phosphotransferase [Labilithrix sp.]|nr:macrolide 2'-phosphotransferase [Labilithrix sp.]
MSVHASQPCGIQTVEGLVEAARELGLHLTTHAPTFDQTGLDFRVIHGEDERKTRWIVRTPRRADVVEAAHVEARALALVSPRLTVAVPSWRVHSDDVIAYPRLDGTPAVSVDANGPTWNVIDPTSLSDTFLDSFAAMLASLQAIDVEEATRAGVPLRTVAKSRDAVAAAMEATREALEPSEALWRRWQRWLSDDALWPTRVALVHGDLHPGHMLLAPDGTLTGVLDWTEAQVTDPSVDLAMFFGCFGADALEDLLIRFARAGGAVWPGLAAHAKERWAALPALGAEWALRTGNDGALGHARAQIAALTEAPA